MKRFFNTIVLSLAATVAVAQNDSAAVEILRPVTSAYSIEVGSSHLTDTYLTPLNYDGWTAAMSYERLQAPRFNPAGAIMQLRGRLSVDRDQNPARNATMWGLDLNVDWGVLWRLKSLRLPQGLAITGGFNTGLDIGALYLARNGNNPVTAKAAWTVGISAMAVYNFRLGALPLTLRYQPSLPLTGVFFSPDYGELYYEIYLGNRSGLAHFAWWGNRMRLIVAPSLDISFRCGTFSLGYRYGLLSSYVNGLHTRIISHTVAIGFIPGQL